VRSAKWGDNPDRSAAAFSKGKLREPIQKLQTTSKNNPTPLHLASSNKLSILFLDSFLKKDLVKSYAEAFKIAVVNLRIEDVPSVPVVWRHHACHRTGPPSDH